MSTPLETRRPALDRLNAALGAVLGAEHFQSEINATANLQHHNLLPLFDSGDADGLLFYVMPLVRGESLRARLARDKTAQPKTIRRDVAGRQVVEGASYVLHLATLHWSSLYKANCVLFERRFAFVIGIYRQIESWWFHGFQLLWRYQWGYRRIRRTRRCVWRSFMRTSRLAQPWRR